MIEKLIAKTKAYFKQSNRTKAVLGLSGGIDSSLCCLIAAKALGPQNVYAYYMPYFENKGDEADATAVAKLAGIKLKKINIKKIVDETARTSQTKNIKHKGNIMSRTRMTLLYAFAAKRDALVIGTGNKTEIALGYFTKWGDGAVDVLPIGNLYKTQVRELAKKIGIPKNILLKPPSAGLWKGQTDEGEIGMTYEEMDKALTTKKIPSRLKKLISATEHKRRPTKVIT